MKSAIKFLSVGLLLAIAFTGKLAAQDDVYYDPTRDKGLPAQQPAEQYDNSSQQTTESYSQQQSDKTDGYGNPADKYDPRDNYNNTSYDNSSYSTDAGYYDEDYDSYFYTTRLRRYYTPSYGTSYYSYWYTPSYYLGYNNWNSTYIVSYSPWYNDPWWRWNRHTTVVVYDPFYSPYWSWNFGWNSCAYYNSWSNPYGGCFGWGGGYSGWGYGSGCGYGGYGYGSGWGYGGGYYNGYYNGYNQGYYNGYNDGYWNSTAYNNYGYHYYGPRHRNAVATPTANNGGNGTGTGGTGGGGFTNPGVVKGTNVKDDNFIPREGITKPINTGNTPTGVKVEAGRPYENSTTIKNDPRSNVVTQPTINTTEGRTNIPANSDGRNASNLKPLTGMEPARTNPTPAVNNNQGRVEQARPVETKPFVRQNTEPDGWHDVPVDRTYGGRPPVQPASPNTDNLQQRGNYTNQQPGNAGFQPRRDYVPQQQPQNAGNTGNGGGWNRREPQVAEPQQPQRQYNNAREIPQQRPVQPQPVQQQPTYREAPRGNFNQAPQQRMDFAQPQQRMNFTPAPQGGGGGFKRR